MPKKKSLNKLLSIKKRRSPKINSKTLHLFGAGNLLVQAAEIGKKLGFKVIVRTSRRLYDTSASWVKKIKQLRIQLFVNNNLKKIMRQGYKMEAEDIGISFGAPWIFRKKWISKWNKKLYNFHNRPLPRHRGAGGPTWMILMREKGGASTIHEIRAGLDDGPIIKASTYKYPNDLKYPYEYDKYDEKKCCFFIRKYLPEILKKGEIRKKQKTSHSTYWPRLNTAVHGWINWQWRLNDIVTFCHAFSDPYEGAKSLIRGNVIFLKKVGLKRNGPKHHPFQTGLIFRKDENGVLHVAHPEGELIVYNYKMCPAEVAPKPGDRLFTPYEILEKSLASKVQYVPDGKIKVHSFNRLNRASINNLLK